MNQVIPPVCSVIIPKEDYKKYCRWQAYQKSNKPYPFPFGLHLYRVTHHRKEIPLEADHPKAAKYRARLKYCKPEEASWVSGSGVCGILSHISDVVMVQERVEWDEKMIKEHQQNAVSDFWLDQPCYGEYVTHEGEAAFL